MGAGTSPLPVVEGAGTSRSTFGPEPGIQGCEVVKQEQEIMDGLFFIQRGYLNGNHFVYRSPEPVLIDTGYLGHFQETEQRLQNLGVDLSSVRLIVSTHTHCDHVGGNRNIQDRSNCDIALHVIGKHFQDTHDGWATWSRYFDQEAEFFRCTRALAEGDRVDMGPHSFRVIYTPGHASDGIVLYNEENRVLLSSDTLWERDMAVLNLRVEGSTAPHRMLESLARLESLDVERVYPGHGSPFRDFRGAIARSRKRIYGYLQDRSRIGMDLTKKILVYTLLMKPGYPESSLLDYLMTTHWFPETAGFYFDGDCRALFDRVLNELLQRKVVLRDQGALFAQVPA
jgi:glyoxylase-like metal-dependent hydrolase (beta-lactamase superfamily II)